MKIRYAAMFSGLSLLIAGTYTATVLHKGMRIATVLLPRQVWIIDNPGLWTLGCWLWLLALFGWMVLVVTQMWSYLPAHRVASLLESGLVIIAAVLGISGIVFWMVLLPHTASLDEAYWLMPLVDSVVLGLLGAALLMGGAVTAWIGWDLSRVEALTWPWGVPPLVAGLLAVPSPFVLPMPWLLVLAGVIWIGWCLFLFSRSEVPNAYSEWQ